MTGRTAIIAHARQLEVGQRLRVSGVAMRDAFPTMQMMEERPPEDQFLETCIGANYGAWTCVYNLADDFYTIGRHKPGSRMVRRDFDRRHVPL